MSINGSKENYLSLKIFIEIPTWLGDAVMSTPAIENIVEHYKDCQITLFGSKVSTQALAKHPNVVNIIEDNSKKSGFRYYNLFKLAKSLERFDIAISFRRQWSSKFLIWNIGAKQKGVYQRLTKKIQHQVQHYNDFINSLLNTQYSPKKLKLYYQPKKYQNPTLGINPGATYGSAKRWYPEKFAEVAAKFSSDYDIVIFGGPSEVQIAHEIVQTLDSIGVKNYQNYAGKTSVAKLITLIGGLDLFITNDSGPMHVAAAYQVPTISIFGPTKSSETSQWKNAKGVIVTKNLSCSPCMKRVCPLHTHECMKTIEPEDILKAYQTILQMR